MNSEEAVWIDGPTGHLFAIVHKPEIPLDSKVCLIMLSAGRLSRVGPQRLYVNAARAWAKNGITVLRLDVTGVGDSESENKTIHFDSHRPADVAAVIQYVTDTLEAQQIYLSGLCAGARLAIKYAAEDSRIAGVLAWNCPIISSTKNSPSSPFESQSGLSNWKAKSEISYFMRALISRKLVSLAWWKKRFLNAPSELSRLYKALKYLTFPDKVDESPFLLAVDKYTSAGRNILFVFGDYDKLSLGEFKERFSNIVENPILQQGYYTMPHGTHTFKSVAEQQDVIKSSMAWMDQRLKENA